MNKSTSIRLLLIIALLAFAQTVSAQQDDRYLVNGERAEWHPVVQPKDNVTTKWYPVSSLERIGLPQEPVQPTIEPVPQLPSIQESTIVPQDDDLLEEINPLSRPMRELSADIREFADVSPEDISSNLVDKSVERWSSFNPPAVAVAWAAPNIRYQPLYFEDVRLERYGQTRGPVKEIGDSAFHFFASAALFPYHAYFDRPQSCDYPLGFCRPGVCTRPVRQLHWWGW